jgi:hypothetical protein
MEQIVALVREYMHAEADAGYPLLRQIPSTRATVCFDYLESISPAEREELLDTRARVTALGFVPTPADVCRRSTSTTGSRATLDKSQAVAGKKAPISEMTPTAT